MSITRPALISGLLLLAISVSIESAQAQYQVGDRVKIGNETGTVIQMGPPIYSGGNQIKVHLDRLGDAYPNVGVMYDPSVVKVQKTGTAPPGGGTTPGGAPGGNGGAPGGGGFNGGMPGGGGFNGGTPAMPGNFGNNIIETAKKFLKGQRVFIGNLNEWGTVVGQGAGPNLVRVHLDRFGAAPSTADFDPIMSKLQAGGAAGAPADPGAGKGAAGDPKQAPGPNDQANQVPDNAAPTTANFKKIIEANIPQPGWGDTITYNWQVCDVSGPMPYVVKYAGHLDQETILGGPGKTVQAYKVHAKYVMTTHYQDPQADDQAIVKEGDYMIYKDPSGHWVPEDVNVQLGPTQYIHKG